MIPNQNDQLTCRSLFSRIRSFISSIFLFSFWSSWTFSKLSSFAASSHFNWSSSAVSFIFHSASLWHLAEVCKLSVSRAFFWHSFHDQVVLLQDDLVQLVVHVLLRSSGLSSFLRNHWFSQSAFKAFKVLSALTTWSQPSGSSFPPMMHWPVSAPWPSSVTSSVKLCCSCRDTFRRKTFSSLTLTLVSKLLFSLSHLHQLAASFIFRAVWGKLLANLLVLLCSVF